MKEIIISGQQPQNSEQVPEKFWDYSSGKRATIDEGKLYAYLNQKGFRYYQPPAQDHKYIVQVSNNTISVLLWNVFNISCSLIDKDFSSLSDDERNNVKEALTEIKDTLKKRKLSYFKTEDLNGFQASPSKQLLLTLSKRHSKDNGGLAK
jgi:hypothetical protein